MSLGPTFAVMAWLVVEDRVVASVEVATTRSARRKGLLGRTGIDGGNAVVAGAFSPHSRNAVCD